MTSRKFSAAFAVCLALSSLPLACGDDEDGRDGTGGSAGGAGKGGSGGKGGTSGTSGTTATGGAGGKGGASGTSGTNGTSGTAGTTPGGAGGADGGMGGEGGGGTTPTQCEAICAKAAHCSDLSTCEADNCTSYAGCEPFDQAIRDCLENDTTSSNFACTFDGKPIYDFDVGGPCDDEIIAWIDQGCI